MNRAVSGTLCVAETGRPLMGLRVVACRLLDGAVQELGWCESGDWGRFRVTYDPLDGPADLFLLVLTADGRLVYTEPVHRAIAGVELHLTVAVPAGRGAGSL